MLLVACMVAAPIGVMAEETEDVKSEEISLPVHEDADTAEKQIYYYLSDAYDLVQDIAVHIYSAWSFYISKDYDSVFTMDTIEKFCDACSIDTDTLFEAEKLYLDESFADEGGWAYLESRLEEQEGGVDMEAISSLLLSSSKDGNFAKVIYCIHENNGDTETIDQLLQAAKEGIKELEEDNSAYDLLKEFYTQTKAYYDSCKDIHQSLIGFKESVEEYDNTVKKIKSDLEFEIF